MIRHHIYLQELIKYHESGRVPRSNVTRLLKIPKSKIETFLDKSLAINGLRLWNELPNDFRDVKMLEIFNYMLKTHLCRPMYNI